MEVEWGTNQAITTFSETFSFEVPYFENYLLRTVYYDVCMGIVYFS